MFDTDRPGYNVNRIYEAADRIKEQRKEDALSRGPDGATRYGCPLGCGADFGSMTERELHLLTDHDRDAA